MSYYQDNTRKISEDELMELYDRLASKWARKMEKRQQEKRFRQALNAQ